MTTNQTSRYVAPQSGVSADWARYQCDEYQPTERQLPIIEAVQSALDAKLYYTVDVLEHCKSYLAITPEQASVNTERVEGGNFGFDCYYARRYIEARQGHEAERIALARLNPHVGQNLGTLIFSDFKRNTGMTITAISEGGKLFDLSGKRGAYKVSLSCTAKQIENAMNRAFEQGSRKDKFDTFVSLYVVKPAAPLFDACSAEI